MTQNRRVGLRHSKRIPKRVLQYSLRFLPLTIKPKISPDVL